MCVWRQINFFQLSFKQFVASLVTSQLHARHSVTMSEGKKLAGALFSWYKDEIGLTLPNEQDSAAKYAELCQTAALRKMWKFWMKYVKSEETVQSITGNVELVELTKQLKDLEKHNDCQKRELASLNAEIQQLETTLKHKKQACFQSQLSICQFRNNKRSLDHKAMLHKAHASKAEKASGDIAAVHQCITIDHKQETMKTTSVVQSQLLDYSTCAVDVSKLKSLIMEQLETGLQEQNDESDSCAWVWKKVIDLTKTYPADFICNALIAIVKEEKEKVLKCEKEINSDKEISVIEKSLITEDTDIGSSEPSPTMTIQRIIQKHNLESLNELIGISQCEQHAEKKQQEVMHMRQSIQNILSQQLQENELHLALNMLDNEMELASSNAALQAMQEIAGNLREDLDKTERMQRRRGAILSEVKNFSKELTENRYRMMLITKQNAEFRSSLMQQQAETLASIQTLLGGKQETLGKLATSLPSTLKAEMKAFNNADILSMMTLPIASKMIPIYDFSIHRPLKMSHASGGQAYQRISAALDTFYMKEPAELLREVHSKRGLCHFHDSLSRAIESPAKKSQEMRAEMQVLNEQVRAFDAKQEVEFVPYIKRAQKAIDGVRKEEEKLKITLQEWFEEPAQDQAPWLSVDGSTLAEMKQRV